ncbi:MAG: ATP-binding cassette domain-containing protein [Cytophagales bacterium]|nr:ATP-binding cassette domain-containing protein [Cytophagales bacterium]
MEIVLDSVGKRYGSAWALRDFSHIFSSPGSTAIFGPNGVGKSTLACLMAGLLIPSEGWIRYSYGGRILERGSWYRHISFTAPYLQMPSYLSVDRLIRTYLSLKGIQIRVEDILGSLSCFSGLRQKHLSEISQGQRQGLYLALAFRSGRRVLLLDEPLQHLDLQGAAWYAERIRDQQEENTIIVFTSQEDEAGLCQRVISLVS